MFALFLTLLLEEQASRKQKVLQDERPNVVGLRGNLGEDVGITLEMIDFGRSRVWIDDRPRASRS